MMGQRCLMFTMLDTQTNSTTLYSFIDKDIFPRGSWAALAYLPRGALIGIFAPWPDRWLYALKHKSFFYSIVPLETVTVYLGIAGLIVWLSRSKKWLILTPLVLSLFMMTIYGAANPFLGSLYRYRYPWWMLLLCLGVASWISLFANRKPISNG